MDVEQSSISRPEILAPAGNKASFLAAVAAGADAVYCGLKLFSARMEAKNFTIEEFTALVDLAHKKGVKVFVAINSLLKPDDLARAGKFLDLLQRRVKPDAIIIQDLGMVPLINQTGFSGEVHLSTLANVSFPKALQILQQRLPVDRVVLPRELNIDELRTLSQQCPPNLDLEVFIHGALCYGVSGRCYWSSYMGGKSGLRGRCVQPCRRRYTQMGQTHRYFSCQDLSLDVLAKVLLSIPKVRTWKIEGRKKGPHYVYYTVSAYRMLRDHHGDPKMKKDALHLLARALGRTGTHYHFLPQRPQNPVNLYGQTGSGLLVGKIKGARQNSYFITREELLPGDVLRIGYEDETGHSIKRIGRTVPKGGRLYISPSLKKAVAKGAPVFLTDRREKQLDDMISNLDDQLAPVKESSGRDSQFAPLLPAGVSKKPKMVDLPVYRTLLGSSSPTQFGLWLSGRNVKNLPGNISGRIIWWLTPVIWPENENTVSEHIQLAIKKGGRHFVLNAPWQIVFFKKQKGFKLWAGPFCNLANPLAIECARTMGFKGAIVSPELGAEDYLQLPKYSPIPLGIVIAGNWPLCIARTVVEDVQQNKTFSSPMGEQAWATRHGSDYWIYPNWKLDLRLHKNKLHKAGYAFFIDLIEPVPKKVKMKKRKGLWNWDTKLR
jgi:U32 family peptidase